MKKIKILLILFTCTILFSSCKNQEQKKLLNNLSGEWKCEESPLELKDIYSGYLTMRVEKSGKFTIYDAEAGNPGIKGRMESVTKDQIILNCSKDEDFDPPSGWDKMKKKQKIHYKIKDKQRLYLVYGKGKDKVTLVFHKIEESA